ncbi:hypothetical protein [Cellulomonas uda]|uniref:Terminase n=1 Tax=Cellulomonas uda TaxID=1714 RepID=A0A4Y3KA95_CELUD|nr:hypothetical protein [Cellulomonas uda]NII65567.1 phage terminase large subunit-like protein [Cellulomonas uda]GEA81401.1 hypothetical protein CUD01_18450 [Cellulomonas uda]
MARPTYASKVPKDTDISVANRGAAMLGLPLFDQGVRVARLLEARRGGGARFDTCVIEMPRRSTKTTSVWAVIVGRAVTRDGYRCVVTAQSGNVASRILLEHAQLLVATGHARYSQERSDDPSLAVVYRNGGRERIDFPNGSRIWVVPPEPGAVRSAAADDILVDEAGEHEGDKGQDFLDAVRPLMDTRGPLAQLIVSGTPGRSRTGMFWSLLEQGRAGADPDLGILDYCIRDDEDPEDRRVWRRVHPGPSSRKPDGTVLTPMRTLEKRRAAMDLVSFAREYLCLWPTDASTGALDVDAWRAGGQDDFLARPRRSVIAFDAPKDQTCCAVVEVWRDDDGKACFEVLAFKPGVSWAAKFAHQAARALKVPVVFDEIGGNVTIAAEIRRQRPGVTVAPLRWLHVGGAAQLFATEIREGRVRHANQPDLNAAIESVGWRPAGRDGRAFGRRPGMSEISPAVAASIGLWHFDQTPAPQPVQIRTAGV